MREFAKCLQQHDVNCTKDHVKVFVKQRPFWNSGSLLTTGEHLMLVHNFSSETFHELSIWNAFFSI